jgi:uncharacterized membrane protein YhdT
MSMFPLLLSQLGPDGLRGARPLTYQLTVGNIHFCELAYLLATGRNGLQTLQLWFHYGCILHVPFLCVEVKWWSYRDMCNNA